MPTAPEVFAALGLDGCEIVETLPPNWHGDGHWRARDRAEHEYSVRAIGAGRSMRVEETRPYALPMVLDQLRVADLLALSGVPMMAVAAGPVVLADCIAVAFEWLDGELAAVADEAKAFAIGQLLAKIHSLRLPGKALPLHDAGGAAEIGLKVLHRRVDPDFLARAASIVERLATAKPLYVVSHGDCNFPNVLWRGDALVGLVDFDQIGFVEPLEELAYAVKWWSRPRGIPVHQHDRALATALLAGYGNRNLDRARLADLLWVVGCLNANSVQHMRGAAPAKRAAVVAHLESHADHLATLVA